VERVIAGEAAALLAEALLASGDAEAAEDAAEQAIELCRRSLRGHYEVVSHGVMARARLRRQGVSARGAAESSLAEAAALIERTGATTFAPALCEWRAELADVLGDDAGAPKHAERLARELAS
jgi:hypothetical protein